MGKIIGIDLGTTNSCVAVYEGGDFVVIPNAEGERTTPSVVSFDKDGQRLVGRSAKNKAIVNPEGTVSSIKRYMGTDHKVEIQGKKYTPQEISAMILQKLKADAEAYLGEPVTEAVITVPANFNDAQRQATKDAGTIAGLTVKRLISEPTAAALAYHMDKEQNQTIMVFDLGGGTFDVSIVELDETGVLTVIGTGGNPHLGGDDFDARIMDWIIKTFEANNRDKHIDLRADKRAMQSIKKAAEDAKKELSSAVSASIYLFIGLDPVTGEPMTFEETLTRAKFDELTRDLVESTKGPVRVALDNAKISMGDVNKVILVGGSTRIPAVQEAVKKMTGKEPFKGINPDECVAVGASVEGGVLNEDVKGVLLLDVTPLSLGIETMGGVFTRLIDRNTTIPVRKSQIFSTAADGQPAVDIHVLQGERDMASGNQTLGHFILDGIAPAPRGVPQIEVTFDIDANGIVTVSATDKGTGKEQHITITSSSNMSKEDIERAVKEAEKFAEEDKKFKEAAETRNHADSLVAQSEKMLADLGDKVTEADKAPVLAAIEKLKETLKGSDVEAIKADTEALEKSFYAISEKLYAQQGGPDMGGAQGGNTGAGDGTFYDADYEDKTDN